MQIIDKLLKRNTAYYQMPILTETEYNSLQKYIFIQFYRTVIGRINLRQLMDLNEDNQHLSLDDLRFESEKSNEILLNADFNDIYNKAIHNSKPTITFFRTDKNENLFWTSSNPAALINIFSLHNPTNDIVNGNTDFNGIYFPMTPHLAALLIPSELKGYNSTIDTFINFNNRILPLDKYELEISVEKVIQGMNWSLMSYMDLLASYTGKEKTLNTDIRSYHFYLISKRFSETEKNYLRTGLEKIEKRPL